MSNKQTYLVIDHEGLHDYTLVKELTDKGVKLSLYSSNGTQWNEHARNQCLLSLINDGNGVFFNKKIKKIDFGLLAELRLLINFEKATDDNPHNREKYRIVEDKTFFEV